MLHICEKVIYGRKGLSHWERESLYKRNNTHKSELFHHGEQYAN